MKLPFIPPFLSSTNISRQLTTTPFLYQFQPLFGSYRQLAIAPPLSPYLSNLCQLTMSMSMSMSMSTARDSPSPLSIPAIVLQVIADHGDTSSLSMYAANIRQLPAAPGNPSPLLVSTIFWELMAARSSPFPPFISGIFWQLMPAQYRYGIN